MQNSLYQNNLHLEATIDTYIRAFNSVKYNENIRRCIISEYSTNADMYLAYRDVIDPFVLQAQITHSNINTITIYSGNQIFPHGSILRPFTEFPKYLNRNDELKGEDIYFITNNETAIIILSNLYTSFTDQKNILYMETDYADTFQSLEQLFTDGSYGITIVNKNNEVVYTFHNLPQEENTEKLINFFTSASKEDLTPDKYVVVSDYISNCQWTVYLYRPENVLTAAASSITLLVIALILVCLLLIIFTGNILARSVVRPIEQLSDNMKEVENGNLLTVISSDSTDEIGQLFHSFQQMIHKLNQMIDEVYKSKILQQKYEMAALQAQINPHFLYNSLSLINWKAMMTDQDEISQMAQLLSTFYRTTLNSGKAITLVKSELDNMQSYIKIQHIMHKGSFHYSIDFDHSIMEYTVLNLLLQPLVENAIIHGLDHKETPGSKHITITGREDKGILTFTVTDNGCGMKKEKLMKILTSQTDGYGVQNVHHRIQLYYGEEYGLQYTSEPNIGTTVIMTLPIS